VISYMYGVGFYQEDGKSQELVITNEVVEYLNGLGIAYGKRITVPGWQKAGEEVKYEA